MEEKVNCDMPSDRERFEYCPGLHTREKGVVKKRGDFFIFFIAYSLCPMSSQLCPSPYVTSLISLLRQRARKKLHRILTLSLTP